MKNFVKWKDKTKGQKIRTIIYSILFWLFLTGTIVVFVFYNQIYGADSIFNNAISDNVFLNWAFSHIPSVIGSIQIIILSIALHHVLKMIMKLAIAHTKKGITIYQILVSFLKWALAIVSILAILSVWGVDTTALIASAGVLTLIVGLGAQSLIADVVAGIFIVFEEEYEVGDIIVLDDWRGTVVEVGIRTTKIQDVGGNVKIINNSEIKSVINQTKENSTAKCYININYEEDMDKVEAILEKEMPKASKEFDNILCDIEYLGISEFGAGGVTLLFVTKCKEADLYSVQRKMNKVLKRVLESHNIGLAYQNFVIHAVEQKKD